MALFFRPRGSSIHTSQQCLSQQVLWQHAAMEQGEIDQTRLAISDAPTDSHAAFSFLVIGDTDAGSPAEADSSFADMFARQVMSQLKESRFLIHTGDIAYPTGNYQNYFTRFLQPYQALLTQLPPSPAYQAQDIIFNKAFLSVPGNHDYSCDATRFRYWGDLLRQACDRLRKTVNIDLGHYGGDGGEAYGQTFLDSLSDLSAQQLTAHLATHYSTQASSAQASTEGKRLQDSSQGNINRLRHCLSYRPGCFTRLPNRYYSFRYGGVDFFALDSNTWNTSSEQPGFDSAQLSWLENSLIRSWHTPNTVGRIVYLHHSPYTTEAFHWKKTDMLWVRRHLRGVFYKVARAAGIQPTAHEQRLSVPVVDLVLSGHAHCFEHLQSSASTLGDQGIDWIVCGGSGADVRPQRRGEADILERVTRQGSCQTEVVATSKRFVGRHKHGRKKQSFHSFIRVDIQPSRLQKITVSPFVVSQTTTTGKQVFLLRELSAAKVLR